MTNEQRARFLAQGIDPADARREAVASLTDPTRMISLEITPDQFEAMSEDERVHFLMRIPDTHPLRIAQRLVTAAKKKRS